MTPYIDAPPDTGEAMTNTYLINNRPVELTPVEADKVGLLDSLFEEHRLDMRRAARLERERRNRARRAKHKFNPNR